MKVAYKTMLELIKQNVHEVDATAQVWLYGSRVRGEAREDSDWDILVLSAEGYHCLLKKKSVSWIIFVS